MYVSVILVALAVVLEEPAGTFVASLDATVYVYVSPDPETNASKSKLNATSLQISAV